MNSGHRTVCSEPTDGRAARPRLNPCSSSPRARREPAVRRARSVPHCARSVPRCEVSPSLPAVTQRFPDSRKQALDTEVHLERLIKSVLCTRRPEAAFLGHVSEGKDGKNPGQRGKPLRGWVFSKEADGRRSQSDVRRGESAAGCVTRRRRAPGRPRPPRARRPGHDRHRHSRGAQVPPRAAPFQHEALLSFRTAETSWDVTATNAHK